jgi:DNA-binding beta-propeller fold protein YncE
MRNALLLALTGVIVAGCGKSEDTAASADACATPGTICTIAGMAGIATRGDENVDPLQTGLYLVQDITVGPNGSIYMMDWNNHRIRELHADTGLVNTIVGIGELGDGPEGPALDALLNHPTQCSFDDAGNLWFAAWHNSRIDKVDLTTGMLSYEAGTGGRAFSGDGGDPMLADLDLPSAVVHDGDRYFFSDQANQVIRMVENGVITTVAGVGKTPGYVDGPGATAQFNGSVSQSAPPTSRIDFFDGKIYVADSGNHAIRVIDTATWEVSTLAGTGEAGDAVGAADQAQFYSPSDVEVAEDGTVYVADTLNSCVKRIKDGQVDVVAGICGEYGYEGDGVAATSAIFDQPYGVETANGMLYIADTYNHVVRAVKL